MKSLKEKTLSGLSWSFIDNFSTQIIQFVVGIILARLLTPREFGLIGMILVFIAVSESFINSGFSSALIRKKECTQVDFSTVFIFNLIIGALFFALLFFTAPLIGNFYNEPELKSIIRVLALILIIDSLTIVQRTDLTRRIDFKLQTRISIIAAITSGSIAILLAYYGFGVWALVAQRLIRQTVNSFLLWVLNRWRPLWKFSMQSFRELFGFGSKLLISGLIDTLYRNVYYLVIGKYFSAQELGFYTRADQFKNLPSQNITSVMSRVTYPVLAQIQDDPIKLKAAYKKIIISIMLIVFVLMLGMAAVAEPMVITLIGEKWRQSIVYLQLLCLAGMMYPLHALNLNMLNVMGRSDLFLKLEIIKKILAVPVIIIGVVFGIKIMIIGMIFNSILAYFLNSYYSGKFINYPVREQVRDIMPGFFIAAINSIIVFLLGRWLNLDYLPILVIQIISGGLIIFTLVEVTKIKAYIYLKEIAISKMNRIRNGKPE